MGGATFGSPEKQKVFFSLAKLRCAGNVLMKPIGVTTGNQHLNCRPAAPFPPVRNLNFPVRVDGRAAKVGIRTHHGGPDNVGRLLRQIVERQLFQRRRGQGGESGQT